MLLLTEVESDGVDFSVLVSGSWGLSLVVVPEAVAATVARAEPPERRADTPVKLTFEVASIDQLHAVITAA